MNDMFLMTFDCFSNMPAGLTACDISTAPPFPTEPDRPGGLSIAQNHDRTPPNVHSSIRYDDNGHLHL